MKPAWISVLFVILLVNAALPADAQDAKSAEAFIRHLYSKYQTQKDFSPFFDQPSVRAISTPSLAALVKRDMETSAAAHDESALDYDPVSGSQDSEGLRVERVKIRQLGPGAAMADVDLKVQNDQVKRHISLVAIKGDWRIDNITGDKGDDDLRAGLAQSIALHAKTRKN